MSYGQLVDPSATRRFAWVRKTTRKQAGIGAKLSGIECGGGKRQRGRNMPASQAIPEIRSASNCRERGTRNHTCHRRHRDSYQSSRVSPTSGTTRISREFELSNCSPNILPSFRRCSIVERFREDKIARKYFQVQFRECETLWKMKELIEEVILTVGQKS